MNLPLIKAALRFAEWFIEAEMKNAERSHDLRECAESLDIVKRAIVDLELHP